MGCWRTAIGGVALIAAGSSSAAQTVPSTLIAGETEETIGCGVILERGLATFQRNFSSPITNGTKAVISFPGFYVGTGGNAAWDLSGQAVLTFSGATAGLIRFKQVPTSPAAIHLPSFSGYSESINLVSEQLIVQFTIGFPSCSTQVNIVYDWAS
jgi:hypothetical protein